MTDLIAQAVQVLRSGNLVAIPTETVYGLAADASNPVAINKIFSTKGRPAGHPLIVHIANPIRSQRTQEERCLIWEEALSVWARDVPTEALILADIFWPGPLTIILPKAKQVLPEITGGQETVGLRCPNHPVALELLKRFEGGLAAPSANKFGHVSPTTAEHVRDEFPGLLVLDGGACDVGIESTIVDLTRLDSVGPVVLRPGAISEEQIHDALGISQRSVPLVALSSDIPRVSGSLSAHYAPRTKLILYRDDLVLLLNEIKQAKQVTRKIAWVHFGDVSKAVLPVDATLPAYSEFILPNTPVDLARNLYAMLRSIDKSGCDLILFQALPEGAPWGAVRDRLSRAAVGSGIV